MNKKRWALLILLVVLVFGYIKLFYKSYEVNAIAKSADCIVVLDVKRVTNTLLLHIITTPSQWKISSSSSKSKDEVDWKDMVEVPDFITPFHVKDQPANTWHIVLKIKDETNFSKGLKRYSFEKINGNEYINKDLGISLFKTADRILLSNAAVGSSYLASVAAEIFTRKDFIAKEQLTKAIDAKSHLAIWLKANQFIQQDGIITANFDKRSIVINCGIVPAKQFSFKETDFSYGSGSLLTAGFTQPSEALYNLLSADNRNSISRLLNVNIDSLCRKENKSYALDIAEIKPRVDSAISYSYDDDFNKVEKMVVNTLQEPAFNFIVNGDSTNTIYAYLQNDKKLETTGTGQLFTPMPFVRSYCNKESDSTLNITAVNYQTTSSMVDKKIHAVLFLNILLTKIPADLLKYLPDDIIKVTSNIEAVYLKANKNNEQLIINCVLQKKKNDLPIIR